MGQRGPKPVNSSEVFTLAHEFYKDFRALVEGTSRFQFDASHFRTEVAEINADRARLTQDEFKRVNRHAEAEIQAGRLNISEKTKLFRSVVEGQRKAKHFLAAHEARKLEKLPGKPEVLKALLQAKTAEKVRKICKRAFVLTTFETRPGVFRELEVPDWPISSGSILPRCLSLYSEQFLAAKRDPRYPRSDRPTNRMKQLWFLSRALAGAVLGIRTRTAINLLGSKRPEEIFEEAHRTKAVRNRS